MTDDPATRVRARQIWVPDWPTVLILVVAIVFVILAWPMNAHARQFPMLAGASCIILATMELVSQYLGHRAGKVSKPSGVEFDWEAKLILVWLFASVLSIYVLGMIGAALVSTTIYYRYIDERSLLASIVMGIVVAVFLWFAFAVLAGFQIYQGALFTRLLK